MLTVKGEAMKTRSVHRPKSIDHVKKLANALSPSLRTRPKPGWIVAIREVTGISAAELARRCKVSRSRIVYAEAAEVRGRITIKSMQAIAEAIDCEFVYAILPKREVKDLLFSEAYRAVEEDARRRGFDQVLRRLSPTSKEYARIRYRLRGELIGQLMSDFWRDSGRKRTRKSQRRLRRGAEWRELAKHVKHHLTRIGY
jgi:predicted DNA-binding mobile mystery protein A